jgi:hypothetical protein
MINSVIISGTVLLATILIIWLLKRNRKDRKDFEQGLNDDYTKPRDEENEM